MKINFWKIYPIIILFAGVIYILYLFISGKNYVNELYSESFKGNVDNLNITAQGYTTIYIDNKEIFLMEYGNELKEKIDEGDSIVKKANSWKLLIFKKNEKEPIVFYPPKR
jgi:hypothetical protein